MELSAQIRHKLDKRKYLYLFVDLEGTIIPNSETQILPRPRQQIIKALEKLDALDRISVNLISEGAADEAKKLIEIPGFNYIGFMGGQLFTNSHPQNILSTTTYSKPYTELVCSFEKHFSAVSGVVLMQNPFYLMIDYSKNYSPSFFHALNMWFQDIYPKIIRYRLIPVFLSNHKVIIKPAKLNKLMAIQHILKEKDLYKSIIIYIGDNFLDEEIFHSFKDKGITIRVENYPAPSNAHLKFKSDLELIKFLNVVHDFYN